MSGSCVATKFIIPTAQTRLESAQQSLSYLLLFLVIHFLVIIALQNLNNAALNLSISGSTCKVYQSVHIKLHHTGIFYKHNDFLSLNKKNSQTLLLSVTGSDRQMLQWTGAMPVRKLWLMWILQPSKRAQKHTGTTGNCVGEQNANPQSKISKGKLLQNQQIYNLNRFIPQG